MVVVDITIIITTTTTTIIVVVVVVVVIVINIIIVVIIVIIDTVIIIISSSDGSMNSNITISDQSMSFDHIDFMSFNGTQHEGWVEGEEWDDLPPPF